MYRHSVGTTNRNPVIGVCSTMLPATRENWIHVRLYTNLKSEIMLKPCRRFLCQSSPKQVLCGGQGMRNLDDNSSPRLQTYFPLRYSSNYIRKMPAPPQETAIPLDSPLCRTESWRTLSCVALWSSKRSRRRIIAYACEHMMSQLARRTLTASIAPY